MLQTIEEKYIVLFWLHVDKKGEDECWPWKASTSWKEYGQFHVKRKHLSAHRFSYLINVGPVEDEIDVLHKCNNPSCVNPKHLKKGTNLENVADKLACNRQYRPEGDLNPFSKLTENEVVKIRLYLGEGFSANELAVMFGVSPRQIRNIKNRTSWTHVK